VTTTHRQNGAIPRVSRGLLDTSLGKSSLNSVLISFLFGNTSSQPIQAALLPPRLLNQSRRKNSPTPSKNSCMGGNSFARYLFFRCCFILSPMSYLWRRVSGDARPRPVSRGGMRERGRGACREPISQVGGRVGEVVHWKDKEWGMGLSRTTGNLMNLNL
jgi:hypothetical protein